MDLDGLLARLIELGGSDMHLKIASPAMARVDGVLTPMEERLLTESDLETVLTLVTERTPAKREQFYSAGELDTAYLAEGLGRFRVNGYRQRGSISFAFRFIPKEIPSFTKLGLPDGVGGLAEEHRGLVLVTGATGSGKSTTLAAMVNSINRSRQQHIVTIEDPIEFVHDDWGCIVNQREVGLDTESYLEALRRVLRQDPDVILIGELRDEESAQGRPPGCRVGPLRPFDHAHDRRRRDHQPPRRVLPARQAADDAPDPRRRPARRRQPAPSAEGERGPSRQPSR